MRTVKLVFGLVIACITGALAPPPLLAAPAPAPDSTPNYDRSRWAIVIGVTNYSSNGGMLPKLRGPSNDARELSDALINKGRFDPKQVIVVAEGTPYPPTRGVILQQLARVTEHARDGLLLFFFAGHGIGSEEESYLLPSDVLAPDRPESILFQNTAIPVSFVRKTIAEAKVKEVVLMLDACRNNPLSPPPPRARSASTGQNMEAFRRAFTTMTNSAVIFSTQTGMEAYETGRDPSVGYFANAIARALMGKERKAINSSGEVTLMSLMDYLPEEVNGRVNKELRRNQRPQMLTDLTNKIVLTYPGHAPGGPTPPETEPPETGTEEPPAPTLAQLRVRLPPRAVGRSGLLVTRNYFNLEEAALAAPLTVEAGKQFVEVRLPGYVNWSREIDLPAGQADVAVTLEPRRTPVYAALGVGALGLAGVATGLVFGARAETLADQVTKACAGGACVWEQQKGKDSEGKRAETLSRVFLISGAVALVAGSAGAAYFTWSRPRLLPEGSGVDVAPTSGGATVSVARRW